MIKWEDDIWVRRTRGFIPVKIDDETYQLLRFRIKFSYPKDGEVDVVVNHCDGHLDHQVLLFEYTTKFKEIADDVDEHNIADDVDEHNKEVERILTEAKQKSSIRRKKKKN